MSAKSAGTKTRISATALGAIWGLSIIIGLFSSSFGRYSMPITSGDWAQHMALVETDFHNARLSPREQPLDPGFMSGYPGWSHAIVAYTAAALNINPLRSMQIWTTIFLITGCFVMALRLAFHAKGPPALFGTVIASIFLAACAFSGFALRGHIERNYFFPQLAGTVIAIIGIAALQHLEWDVTLASLMVVFLGGIVLPNLHLLPAVWFTIAALIILYLSSGNMWVAPLQCALILTVNLFLWRFGAAGVMVASSSNNGWFLTRFAQLSDYGTLMAIGLGIVFCLLFTALLHHLRRNPLAASRLVIIRNAGLVAVCLLICFQAIAYCALHIGSVYSVTKYLYLLAAELGVLLVGIQSIVLPRIRDFHQRYSSRAAVGSVVLLFLCQGPFLATPYDQVPLMRLRARLLPLRTQLARAQRAYPQFPSLGYDQNYYLAIAIMRIPHDERTIQWLHRGATGEPPLMWSEAALVPVPNSDFELGSFAPWAVHLSPEATITGDRVHGGKFALAEAAGDGSVYQDISGLVPGSDYTFTVFVSGSAGGTSQAQLACWDPGQGVATFSSVVTPGPNWQAISHVITAGPSGRIRLHLFRHSGQGTVFWDDARFVANE